MTSVNVPTEKATLNAIWTAIRAKLNYTRRNASDTSGNILTFGQWIDELWMNENFDPDNKIQKSIVGLYGKDIWDSSFDIDTEITELETKEKTAETVKLLDGSTDVSLYKIRVASALDLLKVYKRIKSEGGNIKGDELKKVDLMTGYDRDVSLISTGVYKGNYFSLSGGGNLYYLLDSSDDEFYPSTSVNLSDKITSIVDLMTKTGGSVVVGFYDSNGDLKILNL